MLVTQLDYTIDLNIETKSTLSKKLNQFSNALLFFHNPIDFESSSINEILLFPDINLVGLLFHKKLDVYYFYTLSRSKLISFLLADSKGQYFHTEFRDSRFTKIYYSDLQDNLAQTLVELEAAKEFKYGNRLEKLSKCLKGDL